MRHIRIVISNQTANDPRDTLAAYLSQRIKGRNPHMVELLFPNDILERFDALLRPSATQDRKSVV